MLCLFFSFQTAQKYPTTKILITLCPIYFPRDNIPLKHSYMFELEIFSSLAKLKFQLVTNRLILLHALKL